MKNNKKGAALAITLIVIGIVILLALVIGGITIYQAYSTMTTIQEETEPLQEDMKALSEGDCSKLESVKQRSERVTEKIRSACANPILRSMVEQSVEENVSCAQMDEAEEALNIYLQIMDAYCNNKSIEDIELPEDFDQEAISGLFS